MKLYKDETANIVATQGEITTSGADRLTVTVSTGSATKFAVSGSTSQTAGATIRLTIATEDHSCNPDTAYTGDHSLTFSGANASTNPATQPTVSDKTGVAT